MADGLNELRKGLDDELAKVRENLEDTVTPVVWARSHVCTTRLSQMARSAGPRLTVRKARRRRPLSGRSPRGGGLHMNRMKKTAVVGATLALAGLGAIHSPSGAAPSATGVAITCPSFCVTSGPITGAGIMPDPYGLVSWSGSWTVVSTSAGTVTVPVEAVYLRVQGTRTGGSFKGSGTIEVYRNIDSSPDSSRADDDYVSTPVTMSITKGIIQVTAASEQIRFVGTNVAGGFKGIGTRTRTR